jgi:hypothetical protein
VDASCEMFACEPRQRRERVLRAEHALAHTLKNGDFERVPSRFALFYLCVRDLWPERQTLAYPELVELMYFPKAYPRDPCKEDSSKAPSGQAECGTCVAQLGASFSRSRSGGQLCCCHRILKEGRRFPHEREVELDKLPVRLVRFNEVKHLEAERAHES